MALQMTIIYFTYFDNITNSIIIMFEFWPMQLILKRMERQWQAQQKIKVIL
jgi:hypothetical protein